MPEDPRLEEWARDLHARRGEIFRLRGEFLSGWVVVERFIDLSICHYFAMTERREEFESILLSRLPQRERLATLTAVVQALGLEAELRDVISELKNLLRLRNEFAHSTVTMPMQELSSLTERTEAGTEPELDWYAVSSSRKGERADVIAVEQLKEGLERLAKLDVFRLVVATYASSRGEDPRAKMAEYDEHDFKPNLRLFLA